MLTFDEFMKKKKIDLIAMQQGEPALFDEFKKHYSEMGEKSFDHTKKYWFNKLRRQYHLAPEIPAEKLRNENKLAEQTITDTLTSPPAANAPSEEQPATYQAKPKVGFTPKFRAANAPKPEEDAQQPQAEHPAEDTPSKEKPAAAPPKLGFTPKFRTANTPKPAKDTQPQAEEPATHTPSIEKPEAAPQKLGFTPKFRAANAPKPAEDTQQPQAEEPVKNISPEEKSTPPKLGFTPKFRAANAPKPADDTQQPDAPAENQAQSPEESINENPSKPAYKPRFNIKNLPPKPPQE